MHNSQFTIITKHLYCFKGTIIITLRITFDFNLVQKHLFGAYKRCEPDMSRSKEHSAKYIQKENDSLATLQPWSISKIF